MKKKNKIYGTFLATTRGFGFVQVEGEEDDIFIPERHCKNAFHGDTVEIMITSSERMPVSKNTKRRKEGIVVRVVERKTTRLVGRFSRTKNAAFVIPDFEKYTQDIFIEKGDSFGAQDGHKVVVEIKNYGSKKRNPEGIVVQILGHINDPGIDILSIIKGYDISEAFQGEVMEELSSIPEEVSEEEFSGRADIREKLAITIDGEDAKDLDDAITLEKTKEGEYELGVHIADVSHYVREHTALDKEAKERGTSVYLADRVIPMLPHKLSNGICSLNAGVNRLALSCFMVFDKKGKLKRHHICETVICVQERMNYTDVNALLTSPEDKLVKRYENLLPMLKEMETLAAILRKERKKQGSIDFDFPECKILLDKQGKPYDIVPHERNVATKLIEEFMLAANKTVAEEYFWLEIPFLYRVHETPDVEKIHELASLTARLGYHMKVGKEEVHPREIQKLLEQIKGTKEESFLSRLALRSMKRAMYSTANDGHFGLASKYYSHFTSPIRRYPDLQIHRIIKENIHQGIRRERWEHYDHILPHVALHSSERERRAEEAEREVEKLKKAEYMMQHIGEVYEGMISGVTSWGIYVELPNTVEGMIRLSDMRDDRYEFEQEKYRVIGHYGRKEYQMGQMVRICVERVDKELRTIDFVLADEEETE